MGIMSLILCALFALTLVGCTAEHQSTVADAFFGAATGALMGSEGGHAKEGALAGAKAALTGGYLYATEKTVKNPDGTSQSIAACPYCRTELGLPVGTTEGMELQCPNCSREFKLTKGGDKAAMYAGIADAVRRSARSKPQARKVADDTDQNTVSCPHCGIELGLPANVSAGARLECPSCGRQFEFTKGQEKEVVSSGDEIIRREDLWTYRWGKKPEAKKTKEKPDQNTVSCPHCGIVLQLPATVPPGATLECPACGTQFELISSH
jgi:transcription elongation factor Elf1